MAIQRSIGFGKKEEFKDILAVIGMLQVVQDEHDKIKVSGLVTIHLKICNPANS